MLWLKLSLIKVESYTAARLTKTLTFNIFAVKPWMKLFVAWAQNTRKAISVTL